MEKRTINMIKKKLRDISRYAPNKNLCLKNAQVRVPVGQFKNGKDKFKIHYKCNCCAKLFERMKVEVDHIDEVGPYEGCWNSHIGRLFCELDNLQVLCKPCHLVKTQEYQKCLRLIKLV